MDRKLISNLLGISEKSYYRWKETRVIFKLLEKYFSENEIKEFLETGKIRKLEVIKGFNVDELESLLFKNNNQEEQLIDFVTHNIDLSKITTFLENFYRVEIKDFLYFFQKINEEKPELELENAKKFVLDKIQNDFYNPTIFGIFKAPTKHQQKSLYQLIENKYSNIEVYVLVKKNINLK
ncbi:hypothetical protein CRV02_12900 [Arcobacter sp. CECT 8989]|uniref:hypothetical protein n=1 Tax=Arcobacter sp. CECT 8989 TaxID=2044509 RepID=UPI00100B9A79|nr:hypothetical protein [Arcobacter sp. CECT 8989]RXJ98943.1 hypothetical protein CRV02_12900 [Arcobacter sp. CECT 8989]